MLTMAVIALLGLILLGGICVFFTTRRAKCLDEVQLQMEKDVSLVLSRTEQTDRDLADALERGVVVDHAVKDYQTRRAAILPVSAKTTDPWNWDADDLDRWKSLELRRRGEEVNRALMLPAVGGTLLVVAATVTAIAVVYHTSVSRPTDAGPPSSLQSLPAPANPRVPLPPADAPPADGQGVVPPAPPAPQADTVPPPPGSQGAPKGPAGNDQLPQDQKNQGKETL